MLVFSLIVIYLSGAITTYAMLLGDDEGSVAYKITLVLLWPIALLIATTLFAMWAAVTCTDHLATFAKKLRATKYSLGGNE